MYHIFNQIPQSLDSNEADGQLGVTLGTAWSSDHDGMVQGARFYLGNRNYDGSTIIAAIFDHRSNELLTQQAFTITAAMPLGYTSVPFDSPVLVRRNTWYVSAIYYPSATSSDGKSHFASTSGFFNDNRVDAPPLHAFKNDMILDIRNGLYKYGAALEFPSLFYGGSSYFSDVEFEYVALMPVYDVASGKYVTYPAKRRSGGNWLY